MAQSSKDENSVSTLLGTLNTNGKTPIAIKADPVTHRLFMSNGVNGVNLGPVNAPKDDNDVSALLGASSDGDGVAIPVYSTSNGRLLVKFS